MNFTRINQVYYLQLLKGLFSKLNFITSIRELNDVIYDELCLVNYISLHRKNDIYIIPEIAVPRLILIKRK